MPGDTPVWRYLSFDAVVATIKTRRLRFTRVDKFHDPFEGSVPKSHIDQQQTPLLIGAESRRTMMNHTMPKHYWGSGMGRSALSGDEDSWTRITRLRRAKTRSAHASCWSAGDESELLWRLYCRHEGSQGVGVALRTTLARLEASVAAHDLYFSPITYIVYDQAPPFADEMDHLLHKRHVFAAENELRLMRFNYAQYGALVPKDASVLELPEHIFLEWAPSDVICEIVLSPYADEKYEEAVRAAINASDPNLANRVMLSVLNERRNPPIF
jgi:hypothetical protein